jgi:hypothetical protein
MQGTDPQTSADDRIGIGMTKRDALSANALKTMRSQ